MTHPSISSPDPSQPTPRRGRIKTYLALLVLAACIPYANAIHNDFVWDDKLLINEKVMKGDVELSDVFLEDFFGQSQYQLNYYRPLVTLLNRVEFSLWRLSPGKYHATNIAFHVLCTVLVFWLSFLVLNDLLPSLLAAMLFAVHPIHTQSVTWIAGRTDVICGFFMLVTTITFIDGTGRRGVVRLAALSASLLSYVLALLSKEMAIALPLVLLSYVYLFRKQRSAKVTYTIPFFLLAALYLYWRYRVFGTLASGLNVSDLSASALYISTALVKYPVLLLFPVNLCADYDVFPILPLGDLLLFLCAIVTVALSIWIAVKYSRRHPAVTFAVGWYYLTLLPVLNIIPIAVTISEHYLYIPSVGFSLLLGIGVAGLSRGGSRRAIPGVPRKLLFTAPLLILLFFSALTLHRNIDWADDESLFSTTLRSWPNNAVMNHNLATVKLKQGKLAEAGELLGRAVRLVPEYAEAYEKLGVVHSLLGDADQAEQFYRESIRLRPRMSQAHLHLGLLYVRMKKLKEARKEFEIVVELESGNADAYVNLGNVYAEWGQLREAKEMWQQALSIEPEMPALADNVRRLEQHGY